jgi:outer membrane protein assembly factor BamB
VPVRWTPDSNILWKAEIHDKGWSSPVVYDEQIWVTTASDDGEGLYAVCLDFETGKIIHDIKVFEPDSVYGKHGINTYATPTPCIEKDFVYVHFGRYGTACINTNNGSVIWQRTDLLCNHVQGPGSSPVLYKNLLILHLEGSDVQYIVALNKINGKTVWITERRKELYEPLEPIGKKAYITPLIVTVNGMDLLISNGSAVCSAYDPETGKEIWWIVRGEDSTIAMPFSENGKVYFYTSFTVPPEGNNFVELMAVNPDGQGDIAEKNILWRIKTPVLQLLTPVIKDGLIYTIDSENNLMCIDSETGNTFYSDKVKSKYNSSPVYAAGNIYFCSTQGEIMVIREGIKHDVVAVNELDGEIWSTPAILRNSILIRTSKFLYRIGS